MPRKSKRNKRMYKSVLGIPIWVLMGLDLVIWTDALCDILKFSTTRGTWYVFIITSIIFLFLLILNMIKIKTVVKIAKGQIGG